MTVPDTSGKEMMWSLEVSGIIKLVVGCAPPPATGAWPPSNRKGYCPVRSTFRV